MQSRYRIAADIGGTFTDIAYLGADGRIATKKIPSTPDDYARAVADGIVQLAMELEQGTQDIDSVLHASTIATNAILEGKGARTALITTKGFRDVLELRRIRVPRLYEPLYVKPAPLVPRWLRFEITERMAPDGSVAVPLDTAELDEVIARIEDTKVDAVAVCLLHSYANPSHERIIGDRLKAHLPGVFVSLSVDVLPVIREYERTSTTVINSYVGPPVRRYLKSLINRLKDTGYAGPVLMMQSSGGILDAELILGKPAQIVESGPAAGVVGAAHVARLSGYHDVITLDMGGTTAKAALIENGALTRTEEYEVGGGISLSSRLVKGGGYALKLPVIDVSEVGAGGGSVVWLDPAGSLKVGPESMGAVPGPACYDAGGAEPTVTDANVVLGYLNPGALAGGTIPINASKSRETIRDKIAEPLGRHLLEAAYAVHAVANANMTRAVKAVSTYRGRDPRDFTIFAFGGNGGIHGAAIARILGIKRVVVPPAAGVFSALGLLFADIEVWEACALMQPLLDAEPQRVEAAYRELRQKVLAQIGHPVPDVRFQRMADLRYAGQAFEISVPLEDRTIDDTALQSLATAFENEYEKTYGHRLPGGSPIQFVGIRLSGMVRPGGPRRMDPARVLARNDGGAGRSRPAYFGPELGETETPVLTRADLVGAARRGPAIVEEYEGTIVVPPYASVSIDPQANVVVDLD